MLGQPLLIASALVAIGVATAPTAHALPQFARKLKLDCSGCHDALAFPRLNAVGYKFRRAGFRMPENIGQDELVDFTTDNYFGARIRADNATSVTDVDGSTDWLNTFAGDLTLYPATGSFAKYFASEAEIGVEPGGVVELENAYGRVVYGDQDLWLSARFGVFHPLEGFGASDRSLGPSRPLIFEAAPSHDQDTFLLVTEPDRVGIDVGLQWRNTSLSVEVVNRARLEVEDGQLELVATTPDTRSGKDLVIVAHQILGTRSGLSAYWAHGIVALPVDPDLFVAGVNEDTFDDGYDKLGAFASLGDSTLLGLAGVQVGFDDALDRVTGTQSRFTSVGAFVEGNYGFTAHLVGYLRLDYFDPSTDRGDDRILGGALGVTAWRSFGSLVPELTLRRTDDVTAAALVVRATVLY